MYTVWTCVECGYNVQDYVTKKCPDCGWDRETQIRDMRNLKGLDNE